jgi:hypothetical protein
VPFTLGTYGFNVCRAFEQSQNDVHFIPQLRRPNTSVSIIFLEASGITYTNRTEDPWFSATTLKGGMVGWNNEVIETFVADAPAGVLGCAVQQSLCNPAMADIDGCIFTTYNRTEVADAMAKVWPDSQERSFLRAFMSILTSQSTNYVDKLYSLRGVPALLSRNTLLSSFQTAVLPHDRWMDERQYLFNVSMALLQYDLVNLARGVWDGAGFYCWREHDDCSMLCDSQVSLILLSAPIQIFNVESPQFFCWNQLHG